MKHCLLPLNSLSVLSLLAVLYVQCASVSNRYCNQVTARYPGVGSYTLVEDALIDALHFQFLTFNDSVDRDTIAYLWNAYRKQSPESFIANTEPLVQNIPVMAAVLKNKGYTVATEHPDTYESIYALSKLPLLIWTLIIHHQDKKSTFISEKDITLYKTSLLSPYAADLQLHLIINVEKSGETYKITTHDGLTFSGLANDYLNAQILSGSPEEDAYIQITNCFFITSLPIMEVEEHLEEWFTRTPYEYVKPKIQEF